MHVLRGFKAKTQDFLTLGPHIFYTITARLCLKNNCRRFPGFWTTVRNVEVARGMMGKKQSQIMALVSENMGTI